MSVTGEFDRSGTSIGDSYRGLILFAREQLQDCGVTIPETIVPPDATVDQLALVHSGLTAILQANQGLQVAAPITELHAVHPSSDREAAQLNEIAPAPRAPISILTRVVELQDPQEAEILTQTAETAAPFRLGNLAKFVGLSEAELPDGVTEAVMHDFTEAVMREYLNRYQIRSGKASRTQKIERIQRWLAGESYKEIAESMHEVHNTVAVFVRHFEKSLTTSGYGVEQRNAVLRTIMQKQGIELPGAATVASEDLPVVSDEKAVEDEPVPTTEDVLKTVSKYWSADDIESLTRLLADEQGPQIERAQAHIAALLARHATFDPAQFPRSKAVITSLEWRTLNLLCGFRSQQGVRPLPPSLVRKGLAIKYQTGETTFEQEFSAGLGKLLRAASESYENGWNPTEMAAPAPHVAANPLPVSNTSEQDKDEDLDINQQMRAAIGIIFDRSLVRDVQKDAMAAHLTGGKVEITTQSFKFVADKLRALIREYERAAQQKKERGGYMKPLKAVWLLDELLGNGYAIPPKTMQKIIAERQERSTSQAFTVEDLQQKVLTDLETLAARKR